ncbi:MAG: hypothetical protein ACPLSN_03685 [Dictyoglomus turgidum]
MGTIEAKVYTGGDLWAIIGGSSDFAIKQVVFCYKIAKALYPEQKTYIKLNPYQEEVNSEIKKLISKIRKNYKEEKL